MPVAPAMLMTMKPALCAFAPSRACPGTTIEKKRIAMVEMAAPTTADQQLSRTSLLASTFQNALFCSDTSTPSLRLRMPAFTPAFLSAPGRRVCKEPKGVGANTLAAIAFAAPVACYRFKYLIQYRFCGRFAANVRRCGPREGWSPAQPARKTGCSARCGRTHGARDRGEAPRLRG